MNEIFNERWIQEALKNFTERYGAPPATPPRAKRREELTPPDQTKNVVDDLESMKRPEKKRETDKHKINFVYEEIEVSELGREEPRVIQGRLTLIECSCGYAAMPARPMQGVHRDDIARIKYHFEKAHMREKQVEELRRAKQKGEKLMQGWIQRPI